MDLSNQQVRIATILIVDIKSPRKNRRDLKKFYQFDIQSKFRRLSLTRVYFECERTVNEVLFQLGLYEWEIQVKVEKETYTINCRSEEENVIKQRHCLIGLNL